MYLMYLAGPYRAKNGRTVEQNIATARAVAAKLWKAGYSVICPHLNTAHFDRLYPGIPDEVYLEGDLEMVRRADGVVMLPHWRESAGATMEFKEALKHNLDIWEWPITVTDKTTAYNLRRITDDRSPAPAAES